MRNIESDNQMRIEDLGGGVKVYVSNEHTFGTDSFLLAHFAAPRKNDKACDLGSGCGIIPLLWLRDNGGPGSVLAVDIQPQAVKQMEMSVKLSGLEDRLTPMLCDIRGLKEKTGCGGFDLVVCNPPYKADGSGFKSGSESARIARHETLCTIGDCCAAAASLLRFGGRFCLCQLPERLVDVLTAMRINKIEPKRIRFVQKDSGSAPWLVLVEGKRGAKPFLTAEPALLLYENGKMTKEMQSLLFF